MATKEEIELVKFLADLLIGPLAYKYGSRTTPYELLKGLEKKDMVILEIEKFLKTDYKSACKIVFVLQQYGLCWSNFGIFTITTDGSDTLKLLPIYFKKINKLYKATVKAKLIKPIP